MTSQKDSCVSWATYGIFNKYVSIPIILGEQITGNLALEVSDEISPLEDLDIFLELKYQNTEGQEKLNTTHKPSPPYVAGVPGFSLRANASSNLIRIGERAKFYFDILMRRMVSTLKVEVREETTLFVLNGVCKKKRKI